MNGKRDRVSWDERLSESQMYYSAARATASCRKCGATNVYLKAGPHPSGKRGQPVKLAGPDVADVRAWVEASGFVCQRCAVTTAAAGALRERLPTPRTELAKIRRTLKPLRDAKQTPETCSEFLEKNVRMGVARDVAVVTLRESGKWMEPSEFRSFLVRESELASIIK
jgi:hypothetical protein